MSNIKIGYANAIDICDLVGIGISNSLPISFLQSTKRNQAFRAKAAQVLAGDFDTLRTIGMIALWLPTGNPEGLLFDFKLYNGETLVVDLTAIQTSAFFEPVEATRFAMQIHCSVPTDISRIFIGNVFEPISNFEFGFSMKHKDLSVSERLEDGSLHIGKKEKYRSLSVNLADINNAERAILSEIIRYSGTQNDCYVSLFSHEVGAMRTDFELLGFFDDGAELALTSPNRWNNKLVINEM